MSASIEQIKEAMRRTWMAGDFGVLARRTSVDAEQFASRLPIPPGARVLDIACGTGNVALPLARAGASVTGVDIAPNLLEQGRQRAAEEHLSISFDEGDAEQLPYPGKSFDAAVSMFGLMFAPRPELVVAELARVLRPGGLLAMANWTPASFTGQIFKTTARHVPPPPGIPPPVLWGDEQTVRARLGTAFRNLEMTAIPLDFDLEMNPAGVVQLFRRYFGPTQVAFSRLDEAGQAALAADLEALWASANEASTPESHTLVRNQYLQVVATLA